MQHYEAAKLDRRNSQKHIVPVESNITAKPTKNGPAAPVTLSPKRSSHLKQRKIYRAQIMGMSAQARAALETTIRRLI